jgi:hypothetical protein
MAAGEITQGRRNDVQPHEMEPGDYGKSRPESTGPWFCCTPSGDHGNLTAHDVTEHDDGTITVSPSILVSDSGGPRWHGYLERGVWREV